MRTMTMVGTLALVLALPLAATAQAPAPDKGGMQMEIKQSEVPPAKGRRPVVRPVVPPDAAIKDAEAAVIEMQRERRRAEILREQTQPTARLPWRDRDLTSGIQGNNLQRALGR
jgi:hypothetical protein